MFTKTKNRSAIALMITLFFIMALTVTIGLGLKYVKEGANAVNEQSFMLQTRALLDDFLTMLKTAPQITQINSADTLTLFLSQASFIPLSEGDTQVLISIKSARSKIKPEILNTLLKKDAFLAYLSENGVNRQYLYILDDLISGIKEDGTYESDIFTEHPELFRNYIASSQHLEVATKFYEKSFHDNSLQKIHPQDIFYTSAENNSSDYKLDLNRIGAPIWQILLGCDRQRAEQLHDNAGLYTTTNDLQLSEDENLSLARFHQNISYYEPYLAIKITIMQNGSKAVISFEYNLESKKGSHFVFEV